MICASPFRTRSFCGCRVPRHPRAPRAEGIAIAQEMLEQARPWVQGVQVSAPFGRYTAAADVLSAVLAERAGTGPLSA